MLREFQSKTDEIKKGDKRPISSDGAYQYFHENGIFKYKGSVLTYMDLPAPSFDTPENGDVYNIETGADKDEYGPDLPPFNLVAGDNVVWLMEDSTTDPVTGHWDKLAGNYEDLHVKQTPTSTGTFPILLANSDNDTEESDIARKNLNIAADLDNNTVVITDPEHSNIKTSVGSDKLSYTDGTDTIDVPISKFQTFLVEVPKTGWVISSTPDATFTNTVSMPGIKADDNYKIVGFLSSGDVTVDNNSRMVYNMILSGETDTDLLIFKTSEEDIPEFDVTLILEYFVKWKES